MKTFFNGVDIKAQLNIDATNAGNMFQQMPELKDKVTVKYTSENGYRTDLVNPTYEARTFSLDFVIEAETVEDLIYNYWQLFYIFKVNERMPVYNDYVNMTIFVYYKKQNSLSPIYKTAFGVAQTFQLQFNETDPFENIPIVTLVDDAFNVLVP